MKMWKSQMGIARLSCENEWKKTQLQSKANKQLVPADVCAEGPDSKLTTIKHVVEVEPLKPVSKSRNRNAAATTASGETKILQSG